MTVLLGVEKHPVTCAENTKKSKKSQALWMTKGRRAAYSIRNACIGSIFEARMAGSTQAAVAVSNKLTTIAAKTVGSNGLVS